MLNDQPSPTRASLSRWTRRSSTMEGFEKAHGSSALRGPDDLEGASGDAADTFLSMSRESNLANSSGARRSATPQTALNFEHIGMIAAKAWKMGFAASAG